MSNVEDSDYVGKNHPPRKHRFSSTNQPARRRRRKSPRERERVDQSMAEELLAQLSARVKVVSEGKAKETSLMTAYILRLIKKATEGSVGDQLRFLEFLRRNGLIDLYDLQARLEREARDVRDECRATEKMWAEHSLQCAEFGDNAMNLAMDCVEMVNAARASCSCGCFEDPDGVMMREFAEWLAWAKQLYSEPEEQQTAHGTCPGENQSGEVEPIPAFKIIKKSAVKGDDPNDEFYTGQLGHD